MKIPEIERGQWLVIRIDGTEEPMEGKPSIGKIYRALGVTCCDCVTLRFAENGHDAIVMMVDDTGMVDGKPVNPKATELYHARCKPGCMSAIHGDVAIVNDEDFA
jgi:hypothetical protein